MTLTPRGLRRARRIVWSSSFALGAVALATTAWLLGPLPEWTPPTLDPRSPSAAQPAPAAPDLETLAAIWRRDLRQPPVDAPAAPAAATPETPLPLQLVGTAVEGERRFALFTLSNTMIVKEVGAQVAGFELVSVERGWARLRAGAREHELRVPWYDRLQIDAEPREHP